jgi:hypothetical protein
MTTLTTLSDLREMRTVYKGGAWHFKNNVRRDNIGDFTMGVALINGSMFYVLMARMGTLPPAGSFWYAPYGDGSPFAGWRQSEEGFGEILQPPIKSLPAPSGAGNIDTHAWTQDPRDWSFLWIHSVKDSSGRYHIERATSKTIDAKPAAYTRYSEDLVPAPAEECSIVLDPWTQELVVFFVKKTTEEPDPYGMRFRARVYRASCYVDDFPHLGHAELVYSPDQDGQGEWGTAHTVQQPGFCVLPDRRYLMTHLGKKPFVRHDGKPAVGRMNLTAAVGAMISEDMGRTWKRIGNGPALTREFLVIDGSSGNQLNSPHPWYDPVTRRLYIALALNRTSETNQVGTRLMACEVVVV